MTPFADLDGLVAAAAGGRVAHSGFLAPADASRVRHAVRASGAGATVTGGYPGARRRVVTAHPTHVPEAAPPLTALYLPGVDADRAARSLQGAAVDARWRGDVVAHRDGASVIVLDPPDPALVEAARRAAREAGSAETPGTVPLDRVAAGTLRTEQVIVPSLRVDALGAKGFRTSRSWFAKGIAAGNVYLNGARAAKGSEAAPGDEIWADGVGWIRIESVEGETRRGNVKALLTVEKA